MPMDTATMTGAAASSAAAQITARLDRLPATRAIWSMVLLIALGGVFEVYDLLFTGYIAPGLFRSGIFTATTVSFFGMTGLASFVASLFAGLFVGTIAFAYVADRFGRRAIFTYSLIWYSIATLVLAFQNTPNMVNIWRFIGGVGIGVELVMIDTYISELVPKAMRGKAFAVSQGMCFCVVPLVALLAWLLVPLEPFGLAGWRWVVLIGSAGALCIWTVRRRLPESPRWLAQQGRIEEAERVMSAIEARATADIGRPLPPPGPPVIGDDRVGSYREIFSRRYRTRTMMLIVANFFSTIGFYGFVNWVPTLALRLVGGRRRHHGPGRRRLVRRRAQEGRAGGGRLLVRLRLLCLATRSIVTLGHCRSPVRFSLRGSVASGRPCHFPRHSGARLLRNASIPSRKSSLI